MKIIEVTDRTPDIIGQLLDVWEASVRATHLFLTDGEISSIKAYVPQALAGVTHLIIAEDENGAPIAFMGIENRTLRRRASCGQRTESAGEGVLCAHGFSGVQADRPRRTGQSVSAAVYASRA